MLIGIKKKSFFVKR